MLREKYCDVGRCAVTLDIGGKAEEFKFNAVAKREPAEGPKGMMRSA